MPLEAASVGAEGHKFGDETNLIVRSKKEAAASIWARTRKKNAWNIKDDISESAASIFDAFYHMSEMLNQRRTLLNIHTHVVVYLK